MPANINTIQLGVITPLTQDIQDKNEDVPLMESTGGIEDLVAENISNNDNSVNFFKIVKKLFVKSARKKKLNTSVCSEQLSPDKLSPQSSVGTGSQYQSKGNNVVCCCKTTSWKCQYCKMPTCDFCCVGDTAEEGSKRVCLRKKCSSKYFL